MTLRRENDKLIINLRFSIGNIKKCHPFSVAGTVQVLGKFFRGYFDIARSRGFKGPSFQNRRYCGSHWSLWRNARHARGHARCATKSNGVENQKYKY